MALLRVSSNVQPKVIHITAAISRVAGKLVTPDEVLIRYGMDGVHSANSLHYALRAVDVRTHNFPDVQSKHEFILSLQAELGKDYDLVLEDLGTPNEHLHVEFDPK